MDLHGVKLLGRLTLVNLRGELDSKAIKRLTSANQQESLNKRARLSSSSEPVLSNAKFGRQLHRINTASLISLKKSN